MIIKTKENRIHLDGEPLKINTDLEISYVNKSLHIFVPYEKKKKKKKRSFILNKSRF